MMKKKNYMEESIKKTSSKIVEQFSAEAKVAMNKRAKRQEIIGNIASCGERLFQAITVLNENDSDIRAGVVLDNAQNWLRCAKETLTKLK